MAETIQRTRLGKTNADAAEKILGPYVDASIAQNSYLRDHSNHMKDHDSAFVKAQLEGLKHEASLSGKKDDVFWYDFMLTHLESFMGFMHQQATDATKAVGSLAMFGVL